MENYDPTPVDNQENHGQELPSEDGLNPVSEKDVCEGEDPAPKHTGSQGETIEA